jgi:hypothetical protein
MESIARRTAGMSGAQLADLLNEAAIFAARRSHDRITPADIHDGWLKSILGTSRKRSMDERERSIIAAHEAGHAVCGRLFGDRRRVEEISLFAHGDALGVTVSSSEDDYLPSESDLRARLVALMGGRAAEAILFEDVTGGASNDLEKASDIATKMVTKWGMGHDPDCADLGTSGRGTLSLRVVDDDTSLSVGVRAAMDRAINAILDQAYTQAREALLAEMKRLTRVAAYLYEHERIDGAQFEALFEGRLAPSADVETQWRSAKSKPRSWDEIDDLIATSVATRRDHGDLGGHRRGRAAADPPEARAPARPSSPHVVFRSTAPGELVAARLAWCRSARRIDLCHRVARLVPAREMRRDDLPSLRSERGRCETHLHRHRGVVRPCRDASVARAGSAVAAGGSRCDIRSPHGPRSRCRDGHRNGRPGAPRSIRLRCRGARSERGHAGVARTRDGVYETIVEGHAEDLPFPDATFDHLTFTYLLRYVDDPAATMRELARVVKPGGRVAMVEFGLPRGVWRPLWWLYTRVGLPVAGRLVSAKWSAVGAFLGPSIERFYARHPLSAVERYWREAGLDDVHTNRMSSVAASS